MKIGYARVSSRWYQAELQIAALKNEGCEKIWKDTTRDEMISTSGLENFLSQLGPDTTVIATRLSAVARTLPDLLYFLESVTRKGAKFRSLAEPWCDTSVSAPSELLKILRGTVELDVELKALDTATIEDGPTAVGISVGRPNKLSEREQIKAISLLRIGKSAAEVGRLLGVSRSTISRLKTSLRD